MRCWEACLGQDGLTYSHIPNHRASSYNILTHLEHSVHWWPHSNIAHSIDHSHSLLRHVRSNGQSHLGSFTHSAPQKATGHTYLNRLELATRPPQTCSVALTGKLAKLKHASRWGENVCSRLFHPCTTFYRKIQLSTATSGKHRRRNHAAKLPPKKRKLDIIHPAFFFSLSCKSKLYICMRLVVQNDADHYLDGLLLDRYFSPRPSSIKGG